MSGHGSHLDVRDNPGAQQFEAHTGSGVAFLSYRPMGNAIALTHTEVPAALEGQGVASRLMRGALEQLRSRGVRVVPMCEFAAAYMRRHPEFDDLLEQAHADDTTV